ncbi:chorismate synthase [Candidatus Scalindua japonica]|uniref:Chorismate synthase n=1 Tax=Candidatus Scalindua japonica TaxID=1284222 RepID=A0A286U2F9_9BACT|nr:GNAT family N-acetyltransferase [Candidatus Scalindua japonica]GAX62319.1 chorismate synthase [Candidatus Scalindua japonica]
MSITYKQLKTLEDLTPCEGLQEAVWKFNKSDIIPPRFMRILCKHGGFAMGAFDESKMVGFVFGVPAIHYERPSQHSHLLAVLPEYRNHNIGYKLKLAQREDALSRNIDLITWTFDPLQSRNAHLNINKLGAIACSYDINLYGESSSSKLHSGLGTDRLLAEWWLVSDKVNTIIGGHDHDTVKKRSVNGVKINRTEHDKQGLLIPQDPDLSQTADKLLLEIPDDIEKIKGLNIQTARKWREVVQKSFINYFNARYYINYLQVEQEGNTRRVYYVFERLTTQYRPITLY